MAAVDDQAGAGPPGARDVTAVILTYNSRAALHRCLDAVRTQSPLPTAVVVVDNDSAEPVDDLVADVPGGRVLRLPKNLGPAGGYAAGLRAFLETSGSWAWVLDDDCRPRPDALAVVLVTAESSNRARRPLVLARAIDADTHEPIPGMGWWGVLVPREAVEEVGVPNEALVWWTEDTEYLQWRIPGAGFPVLESAAAVVEVSRTRAPGAKPPWKFYYESRNQVYHRLWVQRRDPALPRPRPTPRHLKVRIRVRRAWQAVWRLGARALFAERTGRIRKLGMVAWGAVDGVRGRLGETVPLGAADRPEIGQSDAG